ncbi:MAG: response regulator transcription factor [Treponema sp.]|jgi:DNA-binding response OmpR family regulator|nr:response regulator transcription factor [Treponema sp.]
MKDRPMVLVVDDEEKIRSLVKSYLEISGYTGLCAQNGREGMELFNKNPVSLILLDLMLPDLSGEAWCRKIREVSDVPIIMITAKVDEESIIQGLNIGADDYVCKPFSPRQLMARVESVLRRTRNTQKTDPCLVYDDLTLDTEKRSLSRKGEAITLTRDEYHILALLMSRQTKIFTRDEILEHIKGETYEGFDRSIDTHIKNLRSKIGDDPKAPKYIVTVYGMGYRFGGQK